MLKQQVQCKQQTPNFKTIQLHQAEPQTYRSAKAFSSLALYFEATWLDLEEAFQSLTLMKSSLKILLSKKMRALKEAQFTCKLPVGTQLPKFQILNLWPIMLKLEVVFMCKEGTFISRSLTTVFLDNNANNSGGAISLIDVK